jgi:nitroreductase
MNTLDLINSRRSIRKFNSKEVELEKIDLILKAAMSAPTARNNQGWRFILVDDKSILNDISQNIEHAKMCKIASKTIIVCYDVSNEMGELYWEQDASASTQNILLAAASLGVGSVWCAIHPRAQKVEYIQKTFNLPQNIKPLSLVVLGYSDENILKEVNRYDKEKVKYNSWI